MGVGKWLHGLEVAGDRLPVARRLRNRLPAFMFVTRDDVISKSESENEGSNAMGVATEMARPPAEKNGHGRVSAQAAGELAVYDKITNVPAFIDQLGDAIHRSGMFGCESPSQGKVLAMECIARRAPPLTLAERYHLIKGKLSMKADAMLADFRRVTGGKHRIIERTADRAAIELSRDGEKQVFELSWETAQEEPFVYNGLETAVVDQLVAGKKPKLKAKYATPRGRSQMLWARVVSDGVRAMAPEVVAGIYTPEELSDVSGVELPAAGDDGTVDADFTVTPDEPAAGGESDNLTPAPANEDQFKRGEPTETIPADNLATAEAEANATGLTTHLPGIEPDAKPQAKSTGGKITAEQLTEAKTLVAELGVAKEKLVAMLSRVGVSKFTDLSVDHAEAMLACLRKEKSKRAVAGNGNPT